ncbi:Nucleoporin nup57 [Vermiconidia calcicola]|uniref:Nucleoporin nup57 n=1 Tax=Vermiconidia calcicola TaxID=1690605 RepID=A0ACC3NPB7_9PEZI|nr:Nucleoporin nup57 [Vermiconidia calcicola]
MSSIFGNQNQNQNQQPAGSGLFGSSTAQNQPAGSGLFGSSTTQNQPQATSLFGGGSNTQTQRPATSGGLFGGGSSRTQNQTQGSNLFGGANTQNQQQGSNLFGGTQNQPQQQQQQGSSLFGGTQNQPQQQQQQQGSSLFGGNTQQTQPTQSSTLFGGQSTTQQPTNNTSLFSSLAAQQPAPANPTSSLFGPPQPAHRSTAERTFTHPQQTHLSTLLQSGLATSTTNSAFATTSQTDLARSRLQAAGINAQPNEKSTAEQVVTLVRKWDPQSEGTVLQKYLYNAVNSAYAPFYYRNAEENEREWEDALANKPAPVESKDGENVSFVPVLVRGFRALGERVEYQARTVNEMRARLHEMNNSLDAVMAKHQQSLTVRLENARRQHAALSQRCLRLAVKAQVLRNRGYPLDAAEEGLRKMLYGLEAQVMDPSIYGREEEIWARMVALRDRARWLEREMAEQQSQGSNGGEGVAGGPSWLTEEVMGKTKKILGDYEGQLRHLGRELEEVRREWESWNAGR